MFDKCPICNELLIRFETISTSFTCKNRHVFAINKDHIFIEIPSEDPKINYWFIIDGDVDDDEKNLTFSIVKILSSSIMLSDYKLENGEYYSSRMVTESNKMKINFYPDCSDMPKLLKKIHLLKVFQ